MITCIYTNTHAHTHTPWHHTLHGGRRIFQVSLRLEELLTQFWNLLLESVLLKLSGICAVAVRLHVCLRLCVCMRAQITRAPRYVCKLFKHTAADLPYSMYV